MQVQERGLIIAIDGPAGAGKSTVAKIIAKRLGYRYINTGDLYRYITYWALQRRMNVKNCEEMDILSGEIAKKLKEMSQKENSIEKYFSLDSDISDKIHSPNVDKNVSFVAQHQNVRKNLVSIQRFLAKNGSTVIEGRDIGSVILPDADLKFFLTADEYTRILRRYEELKERNYTVSFQEVEKEMMKRDQIDSKREIAPLIKPVDAILIDTSNKNIHEVTEIVLKKIQTHLKRKIHGNHKS
ncbi:MAG: (d)CMP kinase [Candidatus Atribacteria bacterium]|nr:(d)CMP kinase [Candidatus Atribacteria bacterium]